MFSLVVALGFVLGACSEQTTTGLSADLRPNVLLIVADDLGYSDLGAFGSEIRTPNLDQLASESSVLTNFHTAPTCGPTRAMLMTGIDHHRVGMGANAAAIQRLVEYQNRRGYEGYLTKDAQTVAELLKQANYQTYMVGKWDLGADAESLPSARGFDRTFALAYSGASHFSDGMGNFSFEAQALYFKNGQRQESLPDDFYSSRFYTDEMGSYIAESDTELPFFAYAAYTAPHWPLQVPDDWLDRYEGVYDAGWEATANARIERLGQIDSRFADAIFSLPRGADGWASLTAEERERQIRYMEIYAAMVEYLDQEIGRLIAIAESQSGDRPLMVIFMSDNGPEGNNIGAIGDNADWLPQNFDMSVQAIGQPGSYSWTGPGWAQVSATPLNLYKSYVTEGGIRTPAMIRYGNETGRSDALVSVKDIPATILDLAGIARPTTQDQFVAMEGKSLAPLLAGEAESVHAEIPQGWELYGNRAVIVGDWKASLTWPPEGNGEWRLFNLALDPGETSDLSTTEPERLQMLIEAWTTYRDENGIFAFDRDLGYGRY